MRRLLCGLASTRLTLVGMALLAVGAGLSYDNPLATPTWVLVAPLGFLALNLLAAILTQPGINRRGGLLLFHIGLLGICVLAAVGRLTFFEGRIEMTEGAMFEPGQVTEARRGPWHRGNLEQIRFIQGPYTVEYTPMLTRGPTRSHVSVPDGRGGWEQKVVGDDTPLLLDGYRFYTSFNKGFAAVLTWVPQQGEAVTGTLHMPSYPLFEFRQDNRWTPPGSEEIKFWLRLDTGYDIEKEWRLDLRKTSGLLVVNVGGQRTELAPGASVALPGGSLRYEGLSAWMGYKIFYDPTLLPLFVAAMLAVFGLAYHYWRKFEAQPMAQKSPRGQALNMPALGIENSKPMTRVLDT